MATTQSEVSALVERRSEGIRTKDIDGLMSVFAPEVVYFDLVPGLRYIGSAALRPRFSGMFDGFEGSIVQEVSELKVVASGDIAVAHMLIRAGGTRKNGPEIRYWVRATTCCERSDVGWLITHEHISMPVDFESGSAAMDLVP